MEVVVLSVAEGGGGDGEEEDEEEDDGVEVGLLKARGQGAKVDPARTAAAAAAATLGCSGLLLAASRAFPPNARPWFTLALCIISEVAGTFCMNLADGFRNPVPSALVFVLYTISLSTLTLALKDLPMSTAYSIWAGTGTALTSALGVIVFHEVRGPRAQASPTRTRPPRAVRRSRLPSVAHDRAREQAMSVMKVASIGLIVAGVVLLHAGGE